MPSTWVKPSRRELAKRLSRGPSCKEPGNTARQHTNRDTPRAEHSDQGQRKIESSVTCLRCNYPLYCVTASGIFPGTSPAGWLGSPGSGSSSWSFNVMHTSNVVPIRRRDARFKHVLFPGIGRSTCDAAVTSRAFCELCHFTDSSDPATQRPPRAERDLDEPGLAAGRDRTRRKSLSVKSQRFFVRQTDLCLAAARNPGASHPNPHDMHCM